MKKLLPILMLLFLLDARSEPAPPELGPPEVEATYALQTISITPPEISYVTSYGTQYVRQPIDYGQENKQR